MPTMNPLEVWGGLAVFGVIAALWRQIRAAASFLTGLLVVECEVLPVTGASTALVGYLWNNYPLSLYGHQRYSGRYFWIRALERVGLVAERLPGRHPVIFWIGRWPLLATPTPAGPDKAKPDAAMPEYLPFTFRYLRGTIAFESLYLKAVAAYDEEVCRPLVTDGARFFIKHVCGVGPGVRVEQSGNAPPPPADAGMPTVASLRFRVGRLLGRSIEDVARQCRATTNNLADLALSAALVDLVREVRHWHNSQAWYRARGIPWKFSVQLHGPPGNGKSSLIGALALDLDIPIFCYDLASLSNTEFLREWRQMQNTTPVIALFEDLHAVFDGSAPLNPRPDALTFNCLLNALDGVDRGSGILTFITTNDVSTLDPALERPGRIDRVLEVGPPDRDGRLTIARRILRGFTEEAIAALVDGAADSSGAVFQESCRQQALAAHFDALAEQPAGGHGDRQTFLRQVCALHDGLTAGQKKKADVFARAEVPIGGSAAAPFQGRGGLLP